MYYKYIKYISNFLLFVFNTLPAVNYVIRKNETYLNICRHNYFPETNKEDHNANRNRTNTTMINTTR